jgi:hypothetical protein
MFVDTMIGEWIVILHVGYTNTNSLTALDYA